MTAPTLIGIASVIFTVLGMPMAESPARADATADPAPVVKTGWWWKVNTETPLDSTPAAVNLPAPPWIPETGLPVAALAGDPLEVSAIELVPQVTDSEVHEYVVRIAESTETGTQLSSATATLLACPISEFWADGRAARWSARPAYDCKEGVPGVRDEAGVWTFDLLPLATGWAARDYVGSESIALVPDSAAGGSFQVVLEATTLTARVVGVPLPPEVTSTEEPEPVVEPVAEPAADPYVAGSDWGAAPPVEPIPVEVAPVAAPPVVSAPVVTAAPAPMAWHEGLGWRTGLLIPGALGLAYLVMLALGPDTQPVAVALHRGRITRALEANR